MGPATKVWDTVVGFSTDPLKKWAPAMLKPKEVSKQPTPSGSKTPKYLALDLPAGKNLSPGPPQGKIPAPLVWARWSFSYPGADFSGSTVTMTRDGSPISADLNAISGGSALDPIIVWRYDGKSGSDLTPHPTPSSDADYEVTINNVNIGGSSRNFTYTVTVFDPDTPGTEFVESTVAGPTNAGTGGPTEFTATVPSFGSGFYWRELTLSPLSVTFGAEGSLQGLVDGTNASYSARATDSTASGNGVYHLTHPEPGVETLTLPDRYNIATNGSPSLAFASRIGFASVDQVATVEISTNGGSSWSAVYEQAGTSNGSAPTESSFQNRSIDLTSFAGRTIKVRFVFTFSSGTFFNSASTNSGWLIDDINLDGAQVAVVLSSSGHVSGTTFDYTASSTGSKGLQVRGAFFDNYAMDWGSVYSVTADSGNGSGSSSGGGGGGGNSGTSRIVNMSVRANAATGNNALNVGVVVGGTGSKSLLIRVAGPTLNTSFGLTGVATDPAVQVFTDGVVSDSNDNWDANLVTTFNTVGAFPLVDGSNDAALVANLTSGPHPALVDTQGNNGLVIVEAYDLESVDSGTARLINVSARNQVGTGADVLVAGFVIEGTGNKTLLIRAIGPTLADSRFNLTGVLDDPQLVVRPLGSDTIAASNDNWNNDATITSTAQTLGAFSLSSTADAAVLVTLAPGAYTATVSGVNDTTGIALVEVYEVN